MTARSRCRLLITDLDNTLYDWVTYYARAFSAMAATLSMDLPEDYDSLISQFKEIHRREQNSEHPDAVLSLPCVLAKFPGAKRDVLRERLRRALQAFESVRLRELRLYEGVRETLSSLVSAGIRVVGHTDAVSVNALERLTTLGIDGYFSCVYCREPIGGTPDESTRSLKLAHRLRPELRKPDPAVVLEILRREQCAPTDALYVGDSLARDVAMANMAGIASVWAEYGTTYDKTLWDLLVRITHWSEADVERESKVTREGKNVNPNFTISRFSELEEIVVGPDS